MSILLFARVAYEQSYDTCFRDYNRIYQVWSIFIMEGKEPEPQTMNMGPLAGVILESFLIFLTDSLSCPVQDQTRG